MNKQPKPFEANALMPYHSYCALQWPDSSNPGLSAPKQWKLDVDVENLKSVSMVLPQCNWKKMLRAKKCKSALVSPLTGSVSCKMAKRQYRISAPNRNQSHVAWPSSKKLYMNLHVWQPWTNSVPRLSFSDCSCLIILSSIKIHQKSSILNLNLKPLNILIFCSHFYLKVNWANHLPQKCKNWVLEFRTNLWEQCGLLFSNTVDGIQLVRTEYLNSGQIFVPNLVMVG